MLVTSSIIAAKTAVTLKAHDCHLGVETVRGVSEDNAQMVKAEKMFSIRTLKVALLQPPRAIKHGYQDLSYLFLLHHWSKIAANSLGRIERPLLSNCTSHCTTPTQAALLAVAQSSDCISPSARRKLHLTKRSAFQQLSVPIRTVHQRVKSQVPHRHGHSKDSLESASRILTEKVLDYCEISLKTLEEDARNVPQDPLTIECNFNVSGKSLYRVMARNYRRFLKAKKT